MSANEEEFRTKFSIANYLGDLCQVSSAGRFGGPPTVGSFGGTLVFR
jgi:hypothetical protein